MRISLGVEPASTEVGWNGQHGHHWIAALAGLLSALALISAALIFLRSARAKSYLTAQDELDLRRLLAQHGEHDSLGYFATRHDKSVIFTPDRSAAVTYRVLANVSLASADPIGPTSAWPAAIAGWLAEARSFGWFPAVLSASEQGAEAYVEAGLKALPIGDEAIIDVDTFTIEGPTMQPVRRAVRRVQRAGYSITVHRHGELTAEQFAELERRAEDWRGDETERGFSMALGRLGDPVDRNCVAVLARDADGELRGMLSMVPWGRRGLSLDLMRRSPEAENGLVEAMVTELVAQARDELGIRAISLNFAMFRGVFSAAERVGAGPVVRVTSRILTYASRFWQIESLYRSNARYLPRWTPRYLCYDSSLTLTRVALAAGAAEGFLPDLGGPRVAHRRRSGAGRWSPAALRRRGGRGGGSRPTPGPAGAPAVPAAAGPAGQAGQAGRRRPARLPGRCSPRSRYCRRPKPILRAGGRHPHRRRGRGRRSGAGAARLRRPQLRGPAGRCRADPGDAQHRLPGRRGAPTAALARWTSATT